MLNEKGEMAKTETTTNRAISPTFNRTLVNAETFQTGERIPEGIPNYAVSDYRLGIDERIREMEGLFRTLNDYPCATDRKPGEPIGDAWERDNANYEVQQWIRKRLQKLRYEICLLQIESVWEQLADHKETWNGSPRNRCRGKMQLQFTINLPDDAGDIVDSIWVGSAYPFRLCYRYLTFEQSRRKVQGSDTGAWYSVSVKAKWGNGLDEPTDEIGYWVNETWTLLANTNAAGNALPPSMPGDADPLTRYESRFDMRFKTFHARYIPDRHPANLGDPDPRTAIQLFVKPQPNTVLADVQLLAMEIESAAFIYRLAFGDFWRSNDVQRFIWQAIDAIENKTGLYVTDNRVTNWRGPKGLAVFDMWDWSGTFNGTTIRIKFDAKYKPSRLMLESKAEDGVIHRTALGYIQDVLALANHYAEVERRERQYPDTGEIETR